MNYNTKVMELFKNPKHSKELKDADGVGEVGNTTCGDVMKVFIKISKNKQGKEFIEQISFNTFGCVAAIASSEALCELVEGKTLGEAEKLVNKDIVNFLGELPPVKMHCSVLGAEALKVALKDYRNKKQKK